jgi:hypothetical protein
MSKIISPRPIAFTATSTVGGVPTNDVIDTNANAGYFRIGNIILSIPPEQIQCHKVINDDEVMPLRFPFAIPIKTGRSRWDVTWSWKALADFDTQDYTQWLLVQRLLAMFKCAPFVEVENNHIRQIVNPGILSKGATQDDAMAFALRQMRVDTVPDIVDALQITMTMSLLNYRPYSINFQYVKTDGTPANALNSDKFQSYLDTWIANNIDTDTNKVPSLGPTVSIPHWKSQLPGGVKLTCREYQVVKLPQNMLGAPSSGVPTPPSVNGLADNVTISDISTSNPLVGWWIKAVTLAESGGKITAKNQGVYNGVPFTVYGLLQWKTGSAIEAMQASDKYLGTHYISIATQAGHNYLVPSSAGPGYSWNTGKTDIATQAANAETNTFISWMSNPPTSVTGGAETLQSNMAMGWAITKLKSNSGSVLRSWEAHLLGQGFTNSHTGIPNSKDDNTWFNTAAGSWRSNPGQAQAFVPVTTPINPTIAPPPPVVAGADSSGKDSGPQTSLSGTVTPIGKLPLTPQIRLLLNEGWWYDYYTEEAAFLYKEHYIAMSDSNSVNLPSSSDIQDIDPNHFVYTNQISVVFVNNIAQLPLASYQYPAYQHLGPVSTLVSIGMLSNADVLPDVDIYNEPKHTGLSLISNLTSMLEDQFQRLRTSWRRVNSLHRMQAVSVTNQVLNMLGIKGLLTKELTTETIPDSPTMVSAQYNAVQYENVYEDLDPWFINPPFSLIGDTWLKTLRNKGTDSLQQQFGQDRSLNALVQLSNLMQDPSSPASIGLLNDWLVNPNSAAPTPSEAYLVPTPVLFTGLQQDLMNKILDESISLQDSRQNAIGGIALSFSKRYTDVANIIKTHKILNYSDYLMLKTWTLNNVSLPSRAAFLAEITKIDSSVQQALTVVPPPPAPLDQLFTIYAQWASTYNRLGIHDQMTRAMNTPKLQSSFAAAKDIKPKQATHWCYADMGIVDINTTPASYFYNDNRVITTLLQEPIQDAVAKTIDSAQKLANATPIANKAKLVHSSTASFSPGTMPGILSTIKPSLYTMAKAFPTFKLFLMEDRNDQPFYSYDDFHSFATVIDMEIIRYRDKPDTAVIQISNLMHLLDQHLYDGTPQGVQEYHFNTVVEANLPSGDALTTTNGLGGSRANVDVYSLDNRSKQINPADGNGSQTFPSAYFALQTGTKIQIRMGFSNDPDQLTPVFTGEVTEIQGDEILTITAQSYMLELIKYVPDVVKTDGFYVDGFINQMENVVFNSIRDFRNGNLWRLAGEVSTIIDSTPAYGGGGSVGGITIPGILSPGGSALDVMSAMLTAGNSKHYGSWQWNSAINPYMKAANWHTALGSVLLMFNTSPLTKGATGLESGYNRSFENILTTHYFGLDGSSIIDLDGSGRGWEFERPGGYHLYGPAVYYVPKDNPKLTPWNLITDIARRFPEFVLTTKQYGFPYSADATLVFANPHDFYATRLPLPNETELQVQAASDDAVFRGWWNSAGRTQLNKYCTEIGGAWVADVISTYKRDHNLGTSFFGSPAEILSFIDEGGVTTFFEIAGPDGIFNKLEGAPKAALLNTLTLGLGTSPASAQSALSQIVQNYYNYIQQRQHGSTAVTLNSRMKPVRQYHLVNGDNIIHNGITLNESFYNTVELNKKRTQANSGIPSQYIRLMNADNLIVSPKNLVGTPEFTNSYTASFLRDEIAKAYRGELVLLGNPDIEPYDVIMLLDTSTGLSGPVEVESVIHSFNLENGYITIVKPRALVIINDMIQAPLSGAVASMLGQLQDYIDGYGVHTAAGIVGEIGVAAGLAAGAVAAGPLIAIPSALLAIQAVFWAGQQIQDLTPLGIIPLSRFQRPWIAGLQGWRTDDLISYINTQWTYFKVNEIDPLIYSYRVAHGMGIV